MGREERHHSSMVVAVWAVYGPGRGGVGEEGGGKQNAVQPGQLCSTVEGEGAGSGAVMSEGIHMVREVDGEEG